MNGLSDLQISENLTMLWAAFYAEVVLVAFVFVLIVAEAFIANKHKKSIIGLLAIVAMLMYCGVLIQSLVSGMAPIKQPFFWVTKEVVLVKFLCAGGLLLIILSQSIAKTTANRYGALLALMLSMLLGANLLVVSRHWLLFYLAIELLSLPGYLLPAFGFSRQSTESATKYAMYGVGASATMLFGISFVYGATGNFFIDSGIFTNLNNMPVVSILGIGFLSVGLLFKLSAFPFHTYIADLYQGASAYVSAVLATLPKVSMVFFLYFVLIQFQNLLGSSIINIIAMLSLATMVVGNVVALWQNSFSRLLAFSSVAQVGFLLVGLVVFQDSFNLLFGYSVVYILATVGAFTALQWLRSYAQSDQITATAGMGKVAVFTSVCVLITMLALTGLPPTAGFTAKLFLFAGLWEAYSSTGNIFLLVLFGGGIINAAISLFYYVKLPYYLLIKPKSNKENSANVTVGRQINNKPLTYLLAVIAFMLIVLFIFPTFIKGY